MKQAVALVFLALGLGVAAPAAAERGGQAGDFDFYVLSLSWSPTYCAAKGDRADRTQCGGSRSYGFVMHGLWPQYERGFPQDCRVTGRQPTRAQVDDMLEIMPSPGLVRHEWRAHGACSGLDPHAYFGAARSAFESVRIPEAFQSAEAAADVSPADVERAFVAANPGLRPAMIAVACDDGMLSEVRICMTKDLAFRPCAEIDRRGCRAGSVAMPAIGAR